MTTYPLKICHTCRHVRDDRKMAFGHWVTKQTYRETTGIDPSDCHLIYTYCTVCTSDITARQLEVIKES